MEQRPARLFLCARCGEQVLLCSRCDRGQLYCGATCSGATRRANQREAGRRYQRGRDGRIKHAERQRRWRRRRRERRTAHAGHTHGVTHHGSPHPGGDAPLPACPQEPAEPQAHIARDDAELALMPASGMVAAGHELRRCRRCATAMSPWVRQGFLRRRRNAAGAHLMGWTPRPRGP